MTEFPLPSQRCRLCGATYCTHSDELAGWLEAAKEHLLDAYADEDAVYDEL